MTLLEPHLDVDQLSAAVDGTRDPAVAAHMLVCLACRHQVDAWRRSLAPLRTLPAPPADVDPVRAALAAWSPARLEGPRGESSGAGSSAAGSAGTGSARAGSSGAGSSGAGSSGTGSSAAGSLGVAVTSAGMAAARRRHRTARLRRLQPPAGVAAALIAVVLVAAAVIGIRAGGSSSSSSSSSPSGGSKSSSAAAPAPQAATAPRAAPRREAVSGLEPASGLTTSGASAAVPAPPSGRAAGAAPSFAGTAQLAAELRRVVGSRPAASVKAGTPCRRQAGADAAKVPAVTNTTPTFSETVRLVGVPSQVFVFALAHGHMAVVVRSSTCSLLATVSF
jgi:hypothetical protein